MDREAYRAHLRGLSDDDLRKESVARVLDYRALPIHSKARDHASDLAALCWGECQDRGQDQLYFDALAEVRTEEARRRAVNQLPSGGTARG